MKIRSIAEAKKKIKIPRQAVVIGIYEYFVHVQLESGVCESVMCMDLINARE